MNAMNHIAELIPPESRLWAWMHRWRIVPVLLILFLIGQLALWALDREPPFKLLNYTTHPARAGGVLAIDASVSRDLDRGCYVELSSSIVDAIGVRWDFGATQSVSPNGIRDIDALSPGKLLRKIQLPTGISPGPASVLSSMTYRCNPLHDLIRPISVQTRFEFEVLP